MRNGPLMEKEKQMDGAVGHEKKYGNCVIAENRNSSKAHVIFTKLLHLSFLPKYAQWLCRNISMSTRGH